MKIPTTRPVSVEELQPVLLEKVKDYKPVIRKNFIFGFRYIAMMKGVASHVTIRPKKSEILVMGPKYVTKDMVEAINNYLATVQV